MSARSDRGGTGRHLADGSFAALSTTTGRVSAWTRRHLESCRQCAAELAVRQRLAEAVAGLGAEPCPDDESLVRLHDGALSAAERRRLDGHLTRCAECAVLFEDLRQGAVSLASGRIESAVDRVRHGASRLASQLRGLMTLEMPRALALATRGGAAVAAGPHHRAGMAAYRAKRYAAALRELAAARDSGESAPEVELYLGACLLRAGRADEAVEVLAPAVARDPRRAELHWYLAQAMLGAGDGAGALEHLRKVARRPGPFRERARTDARRLAGLLASLC